jgi:hypothetical protein
MWKSKIPSRCRFSGHLTVNIESFLVEVNKTKELSTQVTQVFALFGYPFGKEIGKKQLLIGGWPKTNYYRRGARKVSVSAIA